jgi:hypothetical protein
MIRVKINGIEYHIKTEWNEVDADKLMVTENFKEELEVLSDIPMDTLKQWPDLQLFPLYTSMSFIDDMEAVPYVEALDVSQASYEKMELCRKRVELGKPWRKCMKAARVYYPEEKNCLTLIGLGHSIVEQLNNFIEKYQELYAKDDEELSNDEILAGVHTLNAFESWGTAYVLAGRDILKLQQVFDMPAIKVYEALRYNHREAKYMKKLHEIRYPKKA